MSKKQHDVAEISLGRSVNDQSFFVLPPLRAGDTRKCMDANNFKIPQLNNGDLTVEIKIDNKAFTTFVAIPSRTIIVEDNEDKTPAFPAYIQKEKNGRTFHCALLEANKVYLVKDAQNVESILQKLIANDDEMTVNLMSTDLQKEVHQFICSIPMEKSPEIILDVNQLSTQIVTFLGSSKYKSNFNKDSMQAISTYIALHYNQVQAKELLSRVQSGLFMEYVYVNIGSGNKDAAPDCCVEISTRLILDTTDEEEEETKDETDTMEVADAQSQNFVATMTFEDDEISESDKEDDDDKEGNKSTTN